MKVLQLVDSVEYVRTNSFQKQLLASLENSWDIAEHVLVPISSMQGEVPDGYKILSTIKLRSLIKHQEVIKKYLNGAPVMVYEQDPWESFCDGATYPGAYETIFNVLNIKTFLNNSKFWSDVVNSRGMKSTFVHAGIDPNICSVGESWELRDKTPIFVGSVHDWRRTSYDYLKEKTGVSVKFVPFMSSYDEYIRYTRTLGCFIAFVVPAVPAGTSWEKLFVMNGEKMTDSMVPPLKALENAAQGCFTIISNSQEFSSYHCENVPCILTYDNVAEIPSMIDFVSSLGVDEANSMIKQSVEHIKSKMGWQDFVEILRAE